MSYFGSRYIAIRSAAPGDTFVLERGADECSSYLLPYEHFQDERNYKLYLLNCLFIFCKEASETITFSQGFQAAKIKDDN